MKRATLFSILVIFGTASVGIVQSLNSWGGRIFITRGPLNSTSERFPASILRAANISELEGNALKFASQKRLLEDMKVTFEAGRVGIQLGHFLTRADNGQAAYACDVYKQVTLSFVGEGIADSGEKPVMQVTAPCQETADAAAIEPIWIPLTELRNRAPSNADIGGTQNIAHVKFQNVAAEWPSQWALEGVRLTREPASGEGVTSGDDLSIGGDDLRSIVKKPVVVHW